MDDEADSRGPAPPSWPEGIDPEELERQRFQLRKFERVHKQLHTHSNGGTKRKIQGKGTDTGVTRLLRNRSLVASHCPFCTQLRIVNTTGHANSNLRRCGHSSEAEFEWRRTGAQGALPLEPRPAGGPGRGLASRRAWQAPWHRPSCSTQRKFQPAQMRSKRGRV